MTRPIHFTNHHDKKGRMSRNGLRLTRQAKRMDREEVGPQRLGENVRGVVCRVHVNSPDGPRSHQFLSEVVHPSNMLVKSSPTRVLGKRTRPVVVQEDRRGLEVQSEEVLQGAKPLDEVERLLGSQKQSSILRVVGASCHVTMELAIPRNCAVVEKESEGHG